MAAPMGKRVASVPDKHLAKNQPSGVYAKRAVKALAHAQEGVEELDKQMENHRAKLEAQEAVVSKATDKLGSQLSLLK